MITLQNIKTILIVALIGAAIWFFKDWQFQRAENARQTENNRQLRIADSLKYTSQILNKAELADYLTYQNKDLKTNLEKNNIKLNRIESILSQTFRYQDDTLRASDISNIVAAVRNNIPAKQPFSDSTKCLQVDGFVSYENDSMKVNITNRTFQNKYDAVAFWERRQWSFLGIKTRFLGKKQMTAKVFDQCGNTITTEIKKQ